jgi:hypothetical protein
MAMATKIRIMYPEFEASKRATISEEKIQDCYRGPFRLEVTLEDTVSFLGNRRFSKCQLSPQRVLFVANTVEGISENHAFSFISSSKPFQGQSGACFVPQEFLSVS